MTTEEDQMRQERGLDVPTLATAVADAVLRVPGVARLSPGPGVAVATYSPRGRQVGVRVRPAAVAVHLVADRLPLPDLVTAVRAAAQAALARHGAHGLAVDVTVEDLDVAALPSHPGAA